MSSTPLVAVPYHFRVLKAIDGCSISYVCPQGPLWLFYIICVSSGPLINAVYHMHVLNALGCSISFPCPRGHRRVFYMICVSSRPLIYAVYHMHVLKVLDGCSTSLPCPQGPRGACRDRTLYADPPPSPPSWNLAGKCRAMGAEGALREICLVQFRVKNVFSPLVSILKILNFFRRTQ